MKGRREGVVEAEPEKKAVVWSEMLALISRPASRALEMAML